MSGLLMEVRGWTVEATTDPAKRMVVRGVDFDVRRGETHCIVGESGSGKTVLWRTLLGIGRRGVARAAGTARLHVQDTVVELHRRRPRPGWAGYVFQHPRESLDPLRSVGDQLRESIALSGESATDAAVERALSDVALRDPGSVARLHPHELSGGMAQRVAIAVALAAKPELLVADEPTTGLDWSVRREVLQLLMRLTQERGATLVVISHDFAVVRHLADRVLVLCGGELLEDGPREVFFEPGPGRHPYTRELQERAKALADGVAPPSGFERQGDRFDAGGSERPGPPEPPCGRGTDGRAAVGDVTPLLRARGLSRSFPPPRRGAEPVRAVDGVDVELHRGEVVGLVGESGSGKSTLGRLLLQLLPADAGTVEFEGRDLAELGPSALRRLRGRMQWVHQSASAALNPGLTVEQHLQETMRLHRPTEPPDPAIDAILSSFRLHGKRRARPGDLSGGELRRVGLARCLLPRPALVVADEPTAGLDASVKADVLAVLKASIAAETTFLLISHELDVVRWMAHRVLVMKDGRVVQRGAADLLDPRRVHIPRHPYTEQLLGAGLHADPRTARPAALSSRPQES